MPDRNSAAGIQPGGIRPTGSDGRMLLACWVCVVLLFSIQWYAYDATRRTADPYLFYLGWSSLVWALAPFVFWFSHRHPLQQTNLAWWLTRHVGMSAALSCAQVVAEASLGWARLSHGLSFRAALAHYFLQHIQLYVFTYWSVVAAAEMLMVRDRARERELRTARLEAQLGTARLDALRAQLQPHFLFNTLQTSMELVHQDPDAAEDVLLRLSSLLRASLGEFQTHEVTLDKELEFLACYVAIQRRRFGERLTIELQIDPRTLDLAVPSLILQPIVENAVRHGIGAHNQSDRIIVTARKLAGRLMLEVSNRSSVLKAAPEGLPARGVGLTNTRARLRELYGEHQSMLLQNIDPSGVSVRLMIPARQWAPPDRCRIDSQQV